MNNGYNIDKKRLAEHIVRISGGKIDSAAVSSAAAGDMTRLMQALSDDDKKRLSELMNNPSAISKIMKAPAMHEIIQKISGDNKNG